MNRPALFNTTCAASAVLLMSACETLPPGETDAPFGANSAAAAGAMARAAGASTTDSFVAASSVTAVATATIQVIAKHQATQRQRQIAQQRARAAQAKINAQHQREADAARKTGRKYAAKKRPRYLAVDTEKNEQTSPRAKKVVMIWDTQSEQIVGNNVYDVESTPALGQTAKFETYSAEYVGGS